MKFVQEPLSRCALDELVKCRTSLVEIFPATFCPLSTMATLERPSSYIRVRASVSGASALWDCQLWFTNIGPFVEANCTH